MAAPVEEHEEYLLAICDRHYPDVEKQEPPEPGTMCQICDLVATSTIICRSYKFGTVDDEKIKARGLSASFVPDEPSEPVDGGT